jgi:Zn-dependent protease
MSSQSILVHAARDRRTVFVDGRRLLLPDAYSVGETVRPDDLHLPPRTAATSDTVKKMALKLPLLGERHANGLGDLFSFLVPRTNFAWFAAVLAGANLLLFLLMDPAAAGEGSIWSLPVAFAGLALILFWHEIGHCAAARRLGIRVDGMGMGWYLVFPAFFSRVSLVCLLPRRERLVLYASGIYFQLVIGALLGVACLASDAPFLRHLFITNAATIALNLVPVLHLDGYRMLVEITGDRPQGAGQKAIGVACTAVTVLVVGWMTYQLGRSLYSASRNIVAGPSVTDVAVAAFAGAFLLLLLSAAPKWLRRPRG